VTCFLTIAVDDLPDPRVSRDFRDSVGRRHDLRSQCDASPEFQARDRVEALRMLIDLAWTEKRLRELHAFTAVTNHTGNQSLSLQQRPFRDGVLEHRER
jgi:hypothetical protein